jgi:S1-C subfamily serine protease
MLPKGYLTAVACCFLLLSCTQEAPLNAGSAQSSWESAVSKIGPTTYCLGFLKDGRIIGVGTGFAINDSTIATNAHVALGMRDIITDYNDPSLVPIAVKNGGTIYGEGFYFLNSFAIHPGYDSETTETFDFAIVTTKVKMPTWSQIGNAAAIQKLTAGMEVGTIGFPGELNPINTKNPIATFKNGTISAIRAFGGGATNSNNGYYIQHNLNLSGGTSGSPIFNRDGKVIAINNSGVETLVYSEENDSWKRVPIASLGFAIRADQFTPTLSAPKTLFASLKFERVDYTFINGTYSDLEIYFPLSGVRDTIGWLDTLSYWDRKSNSGKEPIQLKSIVATKNALYWYDTLTLGKDFSKRYIVTNQYFLLGVTNLTNRSMKSVVVSNLYQYDSTSASLAVGAYKDVGYYRSASATSFRFYYNNTTYMTYWDAQSTISSTSEARYFSLSPSSTLPKTSVIKDYKPTKRHVHQIFRFPNQ